MQIGADRVALIRRPRSRCGRRCRGPCRTRPRGAWPAPSRVRPPWFSKPASTAGPARPRAGPASSIATLPISRGPRSRTVVEVEQPDALDLLGIERVGAAEQLVAAAHAEHQRRRARRRHAGRRACLPAGPRRRGAGRGPVRRPCSRGRGAPRVQRLAEPARRSARSRSPARRNAARARSGCPGRRRCSSGPGRARRRAAPPAARLRPLRHERSPPRCPSARRSRRSDASAADSRPAAGTPRASCSVGELLELDDVVLGRAGTDSPGRARRAARVRSDEPRARRAEPDGPAQVRGRRRASTRSGVGPRSRPGCRSVGVDLGDDRAGEQRPRREGGRGRGRTGRPARRCRGAAAGSASGTRREVVVAVARAEKSRASAVDGRDGQPSCALGERRRAAAGSSVEGRHGIPRPASSSATRPCAGADVEHTRAAGAGRRPSAASSARAGRSAR